MKRKLLLAVLALAMLTLSIPTVVMASTSEGAIEWEEDFEITDPDPDDPFVDQNNIGNLDFGSRMLGWFGRAFSAASGPGRYTGIQVSNGMLPTSTNPNRQIRVAIAGFFMGTDHVMEGFELTLLAGPLNTNQTGLTLVDIEDLSAGAAGIAGTPQNAFISTSLTHTVAAWSGQLDLPATGTVIVEGDATAILTWSYVVAP